MVLLPKLTLSLVSVALAPRGRGDGTHVVSLLARPLAHWRREGGEAVACGWLPGGAAQPRGAQGEGGVRVEGEGLLQDRNVAGRLLAALWGGGREGRGEDRLRYRFNVGYLSILCDEAGQPRTASTTRQPDSHPPTPTAVRHLGTYLNQVRDLKLLALIEYRVPLGGGRHAPGHKRPPHGTAPVELGL